METNAYAICFERPLRRPSRRCSVHIEMALRGIDYRGVKLDWAVSDRAAVMNPLGYIATGNFIILCLIQ
jgi:hypothetical protein